MTRSSERAKPLAVTLAGIFALVLLAPHQAEAIPAFARKYGFECTQCHTAWPKLNAFGRDFKMNGYRIEGELEDEELSQVVSDFQNWDKSFPISGHLKFRPFDKKENHDSKIRAFHEGEVIFAGRAYKNVSLFAEIEAEDENDFVPEFAQGVVAWNPMPEANLAMGWGPIFWADPFNTLSDVRRLTLTHKGSFDMGFGAGERLRKASQWIGAYGRLADNRVYYLGGVTAGGHQVEGEGDKDVFGRLAFEVTPGVYAGGYVFDGTNAGLDFTRYGFDVQIEKSGFNINGLVQVADDQSVIGGPKDSVTTGYAEVFYTFQPESMPLIVPLARVDFLDDFTDLTTALIFYPVQNIKALAEFWTNLDTPAGLDKNNRFRIQIELLF